VLPRVWNGVEYRLLADLGPARELFAFAAVPWPPAADPALALGGWDAGTRLVGAVLVERAAGAGLLHGPVAIGPEPLEVATQLVSAAVDLAAGSKIGVLFARPQGLDRVWVRFGFIPVPEVALPEGLRGRPGAGLFAYRDGSALWSVRPPMQGAEEAGSVHRGAGPT
jgi:hypothetical protein